MAEITVIEQVLAERGLKQVWLARHLRLSPSGLHRLIHNEGWIQYRRVMRIAALLNMKPESLVDGEGRWRWVSREPMSDD